MSWFTEQNLRAAFRLRAAGQPRPGLRQRIRHATRRAQEARTVAVFHGTEHRRPILVRLTAIATVAAFLILASLVGAGSDVWRGPDPSFGEPTPDDGTAVAIASAFKDGEGDDDDEGDDEDDHHPEESAEDR